MMQGAAKPLGQKAYGSIGHLPGSRLGPGDHSVNEGQERICLKRARDRHDFIVVQEKLDGSCVSVAKLNGELVALGRAGYLANTSPHEQHHLFAAWVRENETRFAELLTDGERVVGEWLAMAHGTRYALPHEPFVPFDLMRGHERATTPEVEERTRRTGFTMPRLIAAGDACPMDVVLAALEDRSAHGAIDPTEGAVWRVERRGVVDFLAKWVRPDKVDGLYFVDPSVWNWHPRHPALKALKREETT